jgi:hypothetical protein
LRSAVHTTSVDLEKEKTEQIRLQEESKVKLARISAETERLRIQEETKREEIKLSVLKAQIQLKRLSPSKDKVHDLGKTEPLPTEVENVRAFVHLQCVLCADGIVQSSELHKAFEDSTEIKMSRKAFATALKRLGVKNNNSRPVYLPEKKESVRAFTGIRMK